MELFDVFVLIIIIMIVGFIVISQQELTKKQVRQRIILMFQEEWTKATPIQKVCYVTEIICLIIAIILIGIICLDIIVR